MENLIFNGEFYKIKDAEIEQGHDFELVFAGSSDNTINLANKFGSVHYYAMESSDQYLESRKRLWLSLQLKQQS